MSDRVCYRYRTPVIFGPWRRRADTARKDALAAGQMRSGDGEAAWRVSGEIEISYCDKGGACGGKYPPR